MKRDRFEDVFFRVVLPILFSLFVVAGTIVLGVFAWKLLTLEPTP